MINCPNAPVYALRGVLSSQGSRHHAVASDLAMAADFRSAPKSAASSGKLINLGEDTRSQLFLTREGVI